MHVHFSFEHETWRNDTGYRILSNLTGNWKFQRLSLITWKHLMSSFNLLHINFIYFPAGIWDTTKSRSSLQGYFQIYFPCKHSKWKKGYFFDYSFIWLTSKEPKTSFGTCELWGGGEIGVEGVHSVASFSAFFFKVNEESLSTTVLWVHKIKPEETIFGLTEIQKHHFDCCHRFLSQNSFVIWPRRTCFRKLFVTTFWNSFYIRIYSF